MDGLKDLSQIDHEYFMSIAVEEAIKAGERGDKAIGAVLVHDNRVVARGSNQWRSLNSKVHHAENIMIIENAQYLKEHGKDCILYTTAEPCLMCLGTIVMTGIRNIVIGTEDPHMHTGDFIESHEWLKSKIFNYLLGVNEQACLDLIHKYCDDRTQRRLLKKTDNEKKGQGSGI